ncbi:HCP-like protein [Roridomyces roridus]|uniref:HCP-like protein n=1 Tax=Roridomyces roridus TaxID=1738132 RepID=A0AAD7FNB7_9AGAR|nr:HCP-like protein [Roridomyces roridus]
MVEVPHAWEDEQKQRVLQRNGRRTAPSTPDGPGPSAYFDRPAGSPLRTQLTPRPTSDASSVYSVASSPRDVHDPSATSSSQPVTLLRRPPSLRPDSPVSLYSAYSFYQLDSASPSPTDKAFAPPSPGAVPPGKRVAFAPSRPPSTTRSSPQTAQDYLQLGIQHHEADRLSESAVCFERAATIDGGCGVGMLMWGLALRHGWGCTKNEKLGFKWLRRAAESAVSDLESARKGGEIDNGAVQTELVLAIYEVGQCFFHGWGVAKDQKMGVSYYAVAARMGDADAQMDFAFCLANGKGSKKDRKEAAKWYRAAVAQGQSDIGLGWIYKDKYR